MLQKHSPVVHQSKLSQLSIAILSELRSPGFMVRGDFILSQIQAQDTLEDTTEFEFASKMGKLISNLLVEEEIGASGTAYYRITFKGQRKLREAR